MNTIIFQIKALRQTMAMNNVGNVAGGAGKGAGSVAKTAASGGIKSAIRTGFVSAAKSIGPQILGAVAVAVGDYLLNWSDKIFKGAGNKQK
jgi:hypothetical protein